ncbi:hypothetical protein SEMRO_3320_G346710.1 [Seminavis robusta]|uniref:Uncharacterized protein n=1 Tax=Seminavis robusta TaxID=568900 RepID=A0A9N8F3U2_9STRA|nr:hypothetical protein SEMRO_3320_G346710.1 [Seminavis robusta]|eukprot:Sro3320_g346710.1 n/a (470) ;mRNA; r:4749-6158
MDAEQIRQLVETAVANAVAATLQNQNVLDALRPPQPVPPPPPPPVAFAINPAGAGNQPWDFTSATGLKIFIASTTPFKILYDGNQTGLRDFLRKIFQRAESYGWTTILMINNSQGVSKNITTQHGSLTVANVRAHAITYLRQQQREHQASACLRKLIASITPKLANRLTTRVDNYLVNIAQPAADGAPEPDPIIKEDGTCMLFELIRMVSVETKATVSVLNKKLMNLDSIMEKAKSNIEDFNFIVEDLIDQLESRSVEPPPMLLSLFDGYANYADVAFVKYMARKQDAYEDGSLELQYETLMHIALEKYKAMINKDSWMKKSDEQLVIIALRSKMEDDKLEIIALKSKVNMIHKPDSKQASDKGAAKKDDRQSRYADKYAWKMVEPKQGEPHEKTVNGKTYIYCPYHDTTKWVLRVNDKGIDHKTGCTKKKEAIAAGQEQAGGSAAHALANALANTMNGVGTATVDDNP